MSVGRDGETLRGKNGHYYLLINYKLLITITLSDLVRTNGDKGLKFLSDERKSKIENFFVFECLFRGVFKPLNFFSKLIILKTMLLLDNLLLFLSKYFRFYFEVHFLFLFLVSKKNFEPPESLKSKMVTSRSPKTEPSH